MDGCPIRLLARVVAIIAGQTFFLSDQHRSQVRKWYHVVVNLTYR
jgi:hypothetical protein